MKNKFTKVISFIMSAVMTVSTLTTLSSSAKLGYVTDETRISEAPPSLNADNNLFGSLKYNENCNSTNFKDEVQNPDYTIYSIEHDRKSSYIWINYHAKEDCVMFVGIYNDEGTELYSSVTKELTSSDDGNIDLIAPGSLPEHYLIKAFLVEKTMSKPLSQPAFYNKETKEMQEILSKTIESFEDDKVVNLDKNEDNNFFVLQDDIIEIKTPEIFIEKDENNRYVFKVCDDINSLKKGDKVVISTEQGVIAFVVDKKETNEDKIIITTVKGVDIGEIFKFIKINTDEVTEYQGKAKDNSDMPAPKSAPQELAEPETNSQKGHEKIDSFTKTLDLEFSGIDNEEYSEFQKEESDIAASLHYVQTIKSEVYYDFLDQYIGVNFTFKYEVSINCQAESKIHFLQPKDKKFISNGKLFIPIWGSKYLGITLSPDIVLSVSGAAEIKFEAEERLSCDTQNGVTRTKKHPDLKELNGKLTVDLRLNLGINISLLSVEVFTVNLYGGIKFELGVERDMEGSNNYARHDCSVCASADLSWYIGVSAEANVVFTHMTWNIAEKEEPIGSFYYSRDIGSGTGVCPNKSHLIKLNVYYKDINSPIKGAEIYHKTSESLESAPIKVGSYTTNNAGEMEAWVQDKYLTDSSYKVIAKKGKEKGEVSVGIMWDPDADYAQLFNIMISEEAIANGNLPSSVKEGDIVKRGRLPGGYTEETNYTGPFTYYALCKNGKCYFWGDLDGVLQLPYVKDEKSNCIGREAIILDSNVIFSNIQRDNIIPKGTITRSYFVNAQWRKVDLGAMTRCTEIPENIFLNGSSIEEIILPPSLIKIEYQALGGCQNLKKIELPNSLEEIGDFALSGTGLKSLKCPENLKTIGKGAFECCRYLREVKLNDGLEYLGEIAFHESGLQSINIPASVTDIGLECFMRCHDLKTVILNADFGYARKNSGEMNIEKIEEIENLKEEYLKYPFQDCDNLEKAILNEGVTTVSPALFAHTPLDELYLPKTLKYICRSAFSGTRLTSVELSENVSYVGGAAFNCYYTKIGSNVKNYTLRKLVVKNPECKFGKTILYDLIDSKLVGVEEYAIPCNAGISIYGYEGSTAEKLAKTTNNNFFSLGPIPGSSASTTSSITNVNKTTTTTTHTTTSITTTIVTKKVSAIIGANRECLFVAVENAVKAVTEAFDLLDVGNVVYVDQKTSDENGNVTFTFAPGDNKKLTYLFISDTDEVKVDNAPVSDSNITMYGDANFDGEFDLSDTVIIMQSLANPNKYGINGTDDTHITLQGLTNGDVYDPGSGITMMDALCIQNYLLGKIESLPVYVNT